MGIYYNRNDSTYTITAIDNIIETTVTKSGKVAANWVDEILLAHDSRLRYQIVGLDLEWCPNTLYGTRGENPVALIQLCVGRRCLIFQLLFCDFIPDKLRNFLKDARFRFAGVGIKEDADKLVRGYGLEIENLVDLRDLAVEQLEKRAMRQWGLKNLVKEVMGVQMEKPRTVALSHWGNCKLSTEQIEYATVDAFASFEVGRRLYARDF
ncbi:hypothetical protein LUZ62_055611 [Rhynchospora pubera]|uniref:3'-5' exonuclease domain-containing protein n=1 Tax=Rhynchospora pubera TaxID=906938 RepID=A0AAV8DW08_9POAL|nr:hypothetical protein LUZ62_055611 [Rhynchospora pubera]